MKDVLILLIPLAGMLITYLLLQHFFNKQLKESERINQPKRKSTCH